MEVLHDVAGGLEIGAKFGGGVDAAVAEALVLGVEGVGGGQEAELDADAAMERAGVGHGEEGATPGREPIAGAPEHGDRVVEMLEDVVAENAVDGRGRSDVLEPRGDDAAVFRRITEVGDDGGRALDNGKLAKPGGDAAGKGAVAEAELQRGSAVRPWPLQQLGLVVDEIGVEETGLAPVMGGGSVERVDGRCGGHGEGGIGTI